MPELPDNNYEEARRWLQNVEDDLHAMRAVVRDSASPRRMVCFLSHLVVEKALKATLIDAGVPFQKTHNLLVLHDSCLERERLVNLERPLLAQCNPWALDGRYADDLADADAEVASRLAGFAEQMVSEVRRELGADRGSL
ncbi:MAG TPA: HEPN domain-containing protein [Acidimicrobiales bacterium]|nr:HEPN domain-containing protein [Acidimicrobiales bacterium]